MVNARICYLIVGIESEDDDGVGGVGGVDGAGGVVVLGLVFVGGIIERLFWLVVVWVVWVEVVLPLFVVCLLVIIVDPPEELPLLLLLFELLKASRILSN